MHIKIISLVFFLTHFLSSLPAHSAVFNVSSGDVGGLIYAINAANTNGEENTINLAHGGYILTSADNGINGLPIITSEITVNGPDAEDTFIARGASRLRIFQVAATGKLTINGLTVSGGSVLHSVGGGIFNEGELKITRSIIAGNAAELGEGGAIANRGRLVVEETTITRNRADFGAGGILNSGIASVVSSTINHNGTEFGGGVSNNGDFTIQNSTVANNGGGGITNSGNMFITNSTIGSNSGNPIVRAAGGLTNRGDLIITNSTISANIGLGSSAGGIDNSRDGIVQLKNTIVAGNSASLEPDCIGRIISLGNNIIGDPSTCGGLLPSDLTGDPGLGAFIDNGAPGTGRFPLLPGSPAIDAGNGTACPPTDQLQTPRRGRCDIGAVEFYPIINNLVAAGNVNTATDPTPVPGGPAGTFRITAEFTNTSSQAIGHRFAEVVELSGGNLLLNADGSAGGVGARLTPPDAPDNLLPGKSQPFEFLIGLQNSELFTFLVNILGDQQNSNNSVTLLGK